MPALLRFAAFELDLVRGELRKAGVLLHLQPQPLKVLACLAARAGELVTREELKRELWGDESFVDFERGLNSCVLLVRSALGDDAQSPRFVRTLPRKGYQFLAPVERVGGERAVEEVAPSAPAPLASAHPDDDAPDRGLARTRMAAAALACAAALGMAAVAWFLPHAKKTAGVPAAPRAMLAVLPFESLDAPGGQEYFADGLTEELITRLGVVDPQGLGVIARTSVMRYKTRKSDVREIGRELGVDHVLEGSVRRSGGRLRITAQLIRVSDQTHVWAETYDRPLGDALDVQDDVALRVARAVSPRFARAAAQPHRAPAAAREAFLKGRYLHAKGSADSLREAIGFYESSTALDPTYAEAYAALADAGHLLRMRASLKPRDVYPKAEAAARRALSLDGALAEGHAALATVLLWYHWDVDGARAELETALSLNPSLAAAHHDLAFLVADVDPERGIREIRTARDLDPLSPRANVDVGWLYLRTRKYAEALAQCEGTLQVEPGFPGAEACVEVSLTKLGRAEEALAFTRRVLARAGATPEELGSLDGVPAAEALRRAHGIRLRRLERTAQTAYVSGYSLAVEHAALGENAAALAALDAAFDEREAMLFRVGADPSFDGLRGEPRFAALVRRVREAAGVPRPAAPARGEGAAIPPSASR